MKVVSKGAALLVAVVAIVGLTSLSPASAKAAPIPTADPYALAASLDMFEDQVMAQLNIVRSERGLQAISRYDSCSDRQAEKLAKKISSTGVFAHSTGKACRGIKWQGQALIRGYELSAPQMVDAWLNSPAHAAILTQGRAKLAGIGITQDADGQLVGVLQLAAR